MEEEVSDWFEYFNFNASPSVHNRSHVRAKVITDKCRYPAKRYDIISSVLNIDDEKWIFEVKKLDKSIEKGTASSLEEAIFLSDLLLKTEGYSIPNPFFKINSI